MNTGNSASSALSERAVISAVVSPGHKTHPWSDSRKRSEQVLVRLTPGEAEDARRLAASHDLTLPALMRAGLALLTLTETT